MMRLLSLLASVVVLAAGDQTVRAASEDLGAKVHVVFELCRPGHSIKEAVTLRSENVSSDGYGGTWILAKKVLSSNEPVYYNYSDTPYRLRAIVARFSDAVDTRFVFIAPAKTSLKSDSWTTWIAPSAVTNDHDVETKILRGIEYDKSAGNTSLPVIRYKLMRFNDFLATVTPGSSPPTLVEGQQCLAGT